MIERFFSILKGMVAQVDIICVTFTPLMLMFMEEIHTTISPLYRYFIGILVLTLIDILAATMNDGFKFSKEKAKESFKKKLVIFALLALAIGTLEFVLSIDVEVFKNFYLTKILCSLHMVMDIRSTLKHSAEFGYTPAKAMFNVIKKKLPQEVQEAIDEIEQGEKQDESKEN